MRARWCQLLRRRAGAIHLAPIISSVLMPLHACAQVCQKAQAPSEAAGGKQPVGGGGG
jgi:hypothetical protein